MEETSESLGRPLNSADGPKASILIVDDDLANLLALRAILEDLSQNIVEAHSGEEAMRLGENHEFAVVLLDVQMPGMSGFETAKLLRGLKQSRHTPLIFLTAYDSDEFPVEQAYSLGAVDYLVKPFSPVVLKAKVAGFVGLYQEKEQAKWEAEQLRLLIHGTTEYAIFLLDPQGRVASWNPGAERIKQYRADEIMGQHFSKFYPQEATDRGFPDYELEVAQAEGRFENEGWRVRKDGTQFWANVVITALRDKTGNLRGFSKITRDMTERKQAEDNARRLIQEETARRAAEENDRRKDEFLATLAHELRNPLAPIRNSLQILKMPRVDAETARQTREVMERQVHHLVRLVDDLLDVSRVMRGKIELRKESVELASVVARAVETAQPLMDAQSHELEISLSQESLLLDVDLIRLVQVVGNLLTNAAKYTEPHGRISLTARREGDEAVLRVRDNGIGIAPDMVPHVFELFVQADHTATRSQGGLGIGLTLVKNLVEMHLGSVEAQSDGLGRGSEFTVRLPLSPRMREAPKESTPDHHPQPPTRSGKRILVVDDNKDAANSLAMLLRIQGHDARAVYDGAAALEILVEYQPMLVFLDIGMPGMDGYEVARRIRLLPGMGHVVLAALTGWGQQEDRRRSAEAGFNHHLVKPPDLKVLQTLLADSNMHG